MKKTAILISMFFLFLGCTQSSNMFLGVGQALDSEPPKINITSPENGIYVNKSSITITGNCVDNVGVAKIRATAGISETASVVTEEIKLPSVRESSWTVTFDENDLDRILNLWRSGLKIAFTFTCYDTAGNSVVEHLFLYVDVELPAVIINRPEVRFTEDEKVKYEKDVASFKADYDINKFEKVNCFVNKEFTIKGYVDDDYSVKSTYINIYNATKKKQVAVTPVIFKDGTYIAGNGNSVGVTGNSQSWEFTLDSTLFCQTEGWHVLEVVTEDEAGNEKRQFVTKDWLYINQAADIPKNNFTSFSPGFKLNAGNIIAGNAFDDNVMEKNGEKKRDGMKEVWIKIVPKSEPDPDTPYTDWVECETPNNIVKRCADFTEGVQLGNWSVKVPSKAGEYIIYAVPVDTSDIAPLPPYEDIYASYFSVASEEDPVVGIDSKFRGTTIVEKTDITGYFYDNNRVSKIEVSLKFDENKNEQKILLYDLSKSSEENEIKLGVPDNSFQLTTGQIVVKDNFKWEFDTARFAAFKVLQMTFRAEDEDGNYGEDVITIYGDSERPSFVGEITPANNSEVKGTNIFSGKVADNVGVVKVIIKNENNSKGWECTVSTPPVKIADGKYESTFKSDNVYPNDFGGYIDSEFTITAIDAAGNEANHIIFLKGDKNKAQIEFYDENGKEQNSGNYATKDKTFDIRITPHHFEDGTYRKISQVSYSLDGKTEKSLELGQYSGGYYSIPLKVSTLGQNVSGDVTLQIKAIDETNNDSQGTIYFIVDNEAPNGLSITSPLLKDKEYINTLTDTAADIKENDISYYQNGKMTLKGSVSDNYKISKTVLDFYKATETTAIYSVELTTDLSVSETDEWIVNKSGIPGNFTLDIDTTKFADGNYILKTTAYDAAGNSKSWGDDGAGDYYFKVLQDADKPRLSFNFDFDPEGEASTFPGTILKGAVVDDDAVAENGVKYIVCFKEQLEDSVVKERFAKSHESVKTIEGIKSFTRQDWQIDEFKNVGTYYLYLQAKDIGGKESEIYSRTINVTSTESPFIKSVTSAAGGGGESNGYYSGKTKIIVNANGGAVGLQNIVFRITSSTVIASDEIKADYEAAENFSLLMVKTEDLGKWHKYTFSNTEESSKENVELLFDSTLFAAGKTETINVEVKCINMENATSVVVKDKVAIDNEGPTLKIASPVSNASVNKIFEISGSCNDRGAGVEAVYVSYQTTPTKPTKLEDITSNLAESAVPTLGKWYKLGSVEGISWNGEFNSEIINSGISATSYTLTVAATDTLNNIGVVTCPITINQDLDRPIVRLQNLSLSGDGNGTIWHKSASIFGTISDDDGGEQQVYISEKGGTDWPEMTEDDNCYSNGSWEYKFDSDGEKKLAFKVVDSKGTTFISADNSGLTVPKIVDSTASNQAASKFTIKVDTEYPSMTDVYFNAEPSVNQPSVPSDKNDIDSSVWSNNFSGKTFGGTEKIMWFLIGGEDANGIADGNLTCTSANTTVTKGTSQVDENNGTAFYSYKIDISKEKQTLLTFKVEVEDKSGLISQKSFTVNVDNTAPTVNINSHSDGSNVYGTDANTIRGTSADSNNVEKIEYALTKDNAAPASGYIEISNPLNWEIKFEDNNKLNDKIATLYSVKNEAFSEAPYDVYLWLKATDIYGNVSEPKALHLRVLAMGDKPKVNIDYPLADSVLGGKITVSGTTDILTSSVKEVYIQIDTDYESSFSPDNFAEYTTDSATGVTGIKVTSSSKTNWRLNINENKDLNGTIAVKAIAVSETGKYTESEIVAFTIDKDVPQFTDTNLVQYQNGSVIKELKYTDEMWVSGDGWYLETLFEDDNGIKDDSINISDGYQISEKKAISNGQGGNRGYEIKVPLNTNGFGIIKFTLTGKDLSDNEHEGVKEFIINYDNTPPEFSVEKLSADSNDRTKIENSSGVYTLSGDFEEASSSNYNQSGFERIAMYFTRTVDGTTYVIDPMLQKKENGTANRYTVSDLSDTDGMYWKEVEVSSVNDTEVTLVTEPNNVHNGGLCRINGAIYRIEEISGNKVILNSSVSQADKIYFAVAQVIDNTIIESGTTTFYSDSNYINYDDGDKMVEGVTRVGTTYNWTASINSENIFDGDVDIHFIAFDKAGNSTEKIVYGKVINNTPRIAGVSFGTDDNGNEEVGDSEYIKVYANSYVAGDGVEGQEKGVSVNGKNGTQKVTMLNLPLEGNTSLMTIKGDTTVKAKIVGGNTKLQWQWKVGNGAWSTPAKDLVSGSSFGDDIRSELSMEIKTIDFLNAGIGNIDNTTLNIRIVDGTENGSQEAEISIKVNTILQDTQAPTVTIKPFYWNSESDNSLYQNSRANGHIELEGDLPSDIFKENTGIYDTDPKVSGKITISGTASDNVLLKALHVTIPGFKNGKEFNVAERNSDGTWTVSDKMASEGWACEILNEQFTKDGNTIDWKIHWDTEKISGIVATNVNVQVRVEDRGCGTAGSSSVEYNNCNSRSESYQMDVVPYITDVKRNTMYSTVRAGSGAYPLLRSEAGNVLKGFNLNGTNPSLAITSDKKGANSVATMESVSLSGSNISFTVPNTAKDGYLHLTVDGIPALNNMNKKEDAPYNSEASAESEYWTDDRYVRIWQDTDRFGNDDKATEENMQEVVLAKNIVWPAMSMSEDGTLYASYTNYGMHNVYYTTVGGASEEIFHANDSPEETTILVTGSGSDAKVNVAFLANNQNGGNYANWTPYRGDAGGLYLHDSYRDRYSRMELLYHDRLFQQFKNFRLARKNEQSGIVHSAYYDIDTMSIHYSNITFERNAIGNSDVIGDSSFEATWVNIDGGSDEHDTKGFAGYNYSASGENRTVVTDGKTNICLGNEQFTGGLSRTSATGEYVGIDVTANEYPVIAYFDSVNKMIKLARANAKNPKSNSLDSSNGANNWKIQRVITDSSDRNYTTANGNYINLQIDSEGHVHIVFVNGRGELVYVKSTNKPSDGNTAYTFGKSVVIAENSPMNVSMTVRGETPYVGYLSSLGSYDGLNTAFWDKTLDLDNNGTEEGGWETMSAPLVHTVANNRACVEARPDPSEWESAHAYYSVGYYRVAYYIGNGEGH